MKVCPLTRIFSPGPAISPNVLLTRDVFYMERVFLYCHGTTEYMVILVGSILQVLQGFMVSLECESHASQIHSPTTVQLLLQLQMHLFSERTVSSDQDVSILVLIVGTP